MKIKGKIRRGFTLVELIVVIAIVAILAAVSIGGYYGFLTYANQSAADQEAQQVKTAIVALTNVSYKGKTTTTNGLTAVSNQNGLRFVKDTNTAPTAKDALSLMSEAYTYSTDSSQLSNVKTFDADMALICDGSDATESKAALKDPTFAISGSTYYITGVTYESKKKVSSIISFSDLSSSPITLSSKIDVSKTPTGITYLSGLKTEYYKNEIIDTSNVWAKVTYSDGTSEAVPASRLKISLSNATPAINSPLIVKKAIQSGTPKVTLAYEQTLGASVSPSVVQNVTIKSDNAPETNLVLSLPDNVIQSQRNKAVDSSSVSGFAKSNEDLNNNRYYVGSKNLKFLPKAISIDNSGNQISVDLPYNYTIKKDDTTLAKGTDYTIDGNNVINFVSDNIVDKENITITATYSTYSVSLDACIIKDAYNVYDQLDLAKYDNEVSPARVANKDDFLRFGTWQTESGTPNTNSYSYYHDYDDSYDGIVLQNNITVSPNLLPSTLFYTSSDIAENSDEQKLSDDLTNYKNKSELLGTLKDRCIYTRLLTSNFTFEGNYFNIDFSQIPLVKCLGGDNSTVNGFFGINERITEREKTQNSSLTYNNFDYLNDEYKINFNHLSVIGNAPKAENPDFFGGLCAFKIMYSSKNVEFNSVNTVNCFMWLGGSIHINGATLNYCKGYNSFNTFFYVNYGKYSYKNRFIAEGNFNDKNESVSISADGLASNKESSYVTANGGLHINNSYFENCGGPAFILDYYASNATYQSAPTVDLKNTIVKNYVMGAEAWFTSANDIIGNNMITSTINTLKTNCASGGALQQPFGNKQFLTSDGYLNMVAAAKNSAVSDGIKEFYAPGTFMTTAQGFGDKWESNKKYYVSSDATPISRCETSFQIDNSPYIAFNSNFTYNNNQAFDNFANDAYGTDMYIDILTNTGYYCPKIKSLGDEDNKTVPFTASPFAPTTNYVGLHLSSMFGLLLEFVN